MRILKLNNGCEMPQIGLGTYAIRTEKFSAVIAKAYELGYRKFDTAQYYENEHLLAMSILENGIPREEAFLTSNVSESKLYYFSRGKRWSFNQKNIYSVIRESFKRLNTDYLDMMCIHWPYFRYEAVWEVLSELYHKGEIRAIGVCSFLPPMLDSLKKYSDVTPALNQFEISPLNTQKNLINYCVKKGIVVEAMSTFSRFRSSKVRTEIVQNELLAPIAEKYDKTIPQIVLRWLLQQGISIIPKSSSMSHLQQNISIEDFELTAEEMETIDAMDKGEFLNYNPYRAMCNIPASYDGWEKFLNY